MRSGLKATHNSARPTMNMSAALARGGSTLPRSRRKMIVAPTMSRAPMIISKARKPEFIVRGGASHHGSTGSFPML